MTRDNVAPAGLPEKEWFSLDEIAERWGCSTDYLIHIGGQGLLAMGVWADGWEIWDLEFRTDGHLGVGFFTLEAQDVAKLEQADGQFIAGGCFGFSGEGDFIFPTVGFGTTGYASKFSAGTDGSFGNRPLVHIVDLKVSRAERDRFEKEHRIGVHAGEMPKAGGEDDREVHPKAKHGMLRVIAALDAYIGAPDEAYNAADAILAKLSESDDLPDRKTLAKYLREAREVTRYR
ncbi:MULTISPECIES: hypothetical protein [unclassified Guyparkeria]|uniref:hypothetical protein n=1 Tax=unclassified Guyparkeria TaxID=2626246 RepID=UPI00073390A3|nr:MULTISPECIES: hypothetical protein [unclassified Guyparkeria]KTG17758.1 hypothetical protein AUR63_06445 [Guyparkeria sp. XI15]OAE89469.1 hypothetical protein AWR35_06455 [Guyparkeria sp. WRN-7]